MKNTFLLVFCLNIFIQFYQFLNSWGSWILSSQIPGHRLTDIILIDCNFEICFFRVYWSSVSCPMWGCLCPWNQWASCHYKEHWVLHHWPCFWAGLDEAWTSGGEDRPEGSCGWLRTCWFGCSSSAQQSKLKWLVFPCDTWQLVFLLLPCYIRSSSWNIYTTVVRIHIILIFSLPSLW